MKTWIIRLAAGLVALQTLSAGAATRIPVLLLDGESSGTYHNWKAVTPVLKKELDETGLFDTEVLTAPPAGADFSQFHPDWKKYRVVVLNYDAPDDRWSNNLKASFEQYMREGGGLVAVHAADNAFPAWKAFNQMIGVGGWRGRDETSGPHWYWKDGKLTADPGPGPAGRHGLRLPFRMTVRDPSHPIMKGLPPTWMHGNDELYSSLRGPGDVTVLATAYSDPANRGSGFEEPLLMISGFGKGRIVHSAIGHDVLALSSVDSVVTFERSVEWAATGKVTQPLPKNFPTDTTISYRADLAAMDPNAPKGMNPLDHSDAKAPPRAAGPQGSERPPGNR